jgi:ABC-type branched-subunit amino acid transport system ATPase component
VWFNDTRSELFSHFQPLETAWDAAMLVLRTVFGGATIPLLWLAVAGIIYGVTMPDWTTTVAELRDLVRHFVDERDWRQFHDPKNLAMLVASFMWAAAIGGKAITDEPVARRYGAGLAHVPEDRHDRALVLDYSIQDNLILGQQRDFVGAFDVLDRGRVGKHADRLIREFDIRPPDPGQPAGGMSGGNQQKLVVARELSRRVLSVLICAQPTRGVDIGAIEAIHRRMIEARDRGLAVLLLSAELSELRSLSDRLAVLYKGQIVATPGRDQLAAADALDKIGAMMTGAWTHGDGVEAAPR